MRETAVPRTLKTKRLLLRCPRPEDGPALHAALLDSQERLRPWFKWVTGAVLTPERSVASAQFAQWLFMARRELQFYLFLRETEQFIGICGLCHPDWSVPQFEVRYWLRTDFDGHGYMTEAVTAVVDLACERFQARRIEIHCDPHNAESMALAERLGFTPETNASTPDEIVFTRISHG